MKSRTAKEEHPRIQIARGTVTYSAAAAESEPMIPQHTGRTHRKRNKVESRYGLWVLGYVLST